VPSIRTSALRRYSLVAVLNTRPATVPVPCANANGTITERQPRQEPPNAREPAKTNG
jgi:hypothetical protein